MENEKCANCQKPKAEHVHIGDKIWCSSDHRDLRTWKQPAPQAVLFPDVHRSVGYEL